MRKVEGVRQRVEAVGTRLPHSPDLNPIEKAGFKLKTLVHSQKVQTPEALHNAIERRLPAITAQDAQAGSDSRSLYSDEDTALAIALEIATVGLLCCVSLLSLGSIFL